MSPLRDVRVLDVGGGVAGAWCARLLGGLGAEVLKVEPPGGDPTRLLGPPLPDGPPHALFRFLNAAKRSVALDHAAPADRARLADLIRHCDVLVETLCPGTLAAWGLDPAEVRHAQPALIVASLTPFGQEFPRHTWRADELVLQAEGGLLNLTGPPDEPPRRVAGLPAQMAAGVHGAVAVLAALAGRAGGWIDLSVAAVVASLLEGALTQYAYSGFARRRTGNRRVHSHPMTVLPCRDGYAGIFVASPADWETFARFAGHPEWVDDPRFATPAARVAHADELDALLVGWLAAWDRAALFGEAQAWRLPFATALRPAEVRADPHLQARHFWGPDPSLPPRHGDWAMRRRGDVGPSPGLPVFLSARPRGLPGPPFRLGELRDDPAAGPEALPWRRGPAPAVEGAADLAAHWLAEPPHQATPAAAGGRPLAGLRVLDLTALWAGPYATRLLADLGAEVVKVEGPWRPDGTRGPAHAAPAPIYPARQPGARPYNRAALFSELNRNKRGLALDLRQPAAVALLRDLAARADVLVESFSPRVLPSWGLDDDALTRLNPRLIIVHMPAFGSSGPYRDAVALGGGLDLMSGLAHATGLPGPPLLAGAALPDPVAGATAALATLAALRWRERSGHGLRVEVAQWEA
ncbi:MAG: CoA transferase, partial [Chloroflexi bacterium]|nr:CoA transferase [Chloroflexota bacterium]